MERHWTDPEKWRDDAWYVLGVARALDVTPQQVLDQTWDEIASQLDQQKVYRVATWMQHRGSPEFYTREHVRDLRERGKL